MTLAITIILVLTVIIYRNIDLPEYVSPSFENYTYKRIKNENIELEYWIHKSEKDYVLLINGGPGVPHYLEEIGNHLIESGFGVILYNQRGTGNSKSLTNTYTIQDHLSDIDLILNETELDKIHLIGHSWGGLLSQLYLNENKEKVKSLMLISSSTGIGRDWIKMEKNVMKYNKDKSGLLIWTKMGMFSGLSLMNNKIGNIASRKMMNLVWKNYFSNPKDVLNADSNWLNGINSSPIRKTRKSIIENHDNLNFEDVNIPVMIIYGEYDIYNTEYKLIYDRFKKSKNVIIEYSGHLPWLQNSTNFFNILDTFYCEKSSEM